MQEINIYLSEHRKQRSALERNKHLALWYIINKNLFLGINRDPPGGHKEKHAPQRSMIMTDVDDITYPDDRVGPLMPRGGDITEIVEISKGFGKFEGIKGIKPIDSRNTSSEAEALDIVLKCM